MPKTPDRRNGPGFQIMPRSGPQLLMGQEGIAKIVELVADATLATYPSVDVKRLITQAGQVNPVTQDRLNKDRSVATQERIVPGYFKLLGFEDRRLAYFNASNKEVSSNLEVKPQGQGSCLNISQDLLSGFYSESREVRQKAAVVFGYHLMAANFDLILDPQDLTPELSLRSERLFKVQLHHNLLRVLGSMPEDETDEDSFDVVRAMISGLIEHKGSAYNPRAVALGGTLNLVLPGQTIGSPELVIGESFNQDLYSYFVRPVAERFGKLFAAAGFANGGNPIIRREVIEQGAKAEKFLAMLGFTNIKGSFEEYRRSNIAIEALKQRGGFHFIKLEAIPGFEVPPSRKAPEDLE